MSGDRFQPLRSRLVVGMVIGLSILFLSCSVETNVVQRTKRGILQGIVRDGTLGLIEEEPPAEPPATPQPTTADQTKVTTTDLPPATPRRGEVPWEGRSLERPKASGRTTFGRGLPGVSISAFVDGSYKSTTTSKDDPRTPQDEAGSFTLHDLPSGVSVPITFSLKDYAAVRASFTIPAAISAGGAVTLEDPQLTIEIDLVKASGQLTVNVYADKGPAKGARVLLDLTGGPLVNTTGGNLSGGFDFFREKTSDENGQVVFEELPATVIPAGSLVVLPFDADGDAQPDYSTYTNTAPIDLSHLTAGSGMSVINVNLPVSNSIAPTVVWSNIAAKRPFNRAENIVLVFSQPIDPTSFLATLTSSDLNIAYQTTWDPAKVKATLDPLQDLEPGNTYQFSVTRAISLTGQFMAAFTTIGFPVIEGLSALASPKVSYWNNADKSSTRSDADVDYNTRQVDIQWPAVADAVNYLILAKDNKKNSDWVQIAQKGPTAGTQFLDMDKTTQLPTEFDAFTGDADATPFAFGTQVAFAVIAVNRDGIPGVVDNGSTFVASDKKAPSTSATKQTRQTGQTNIQADDTAANGTGTTDKFLVVRLTFSEFMDTSAGVAVNMIQEGDSNSCPTAGTLNAGNNTGGSSLEGTWVWDQDTISGYVKVKIPAGQDAREDCVEFDPSGAKDSSGNAISMPAGATSLKTIHRFN